jgi:hypothetical protein
METSLPEPVRLLEISILKAQDSAARIELSRLCCKETIIKTLLQGNYCWCASIIMSMSPGLYYQESVATSLLSRLYCEDTIISCEDSDSSRHSNLQELFLLGDYFQRMSSASVWIQLWRGSRIQTSRASDIASSRRSKLQDLFLLRIYFQSM